NAVPALGSSVNIACKSVRSSDIRLYFFASRLACLVKLSRARILKLINQLAQWHAGFTAFLYLFSLRHALRKFFIKPFFFLLFKIRANRLKDKIGAIKRVAGGQLIKLLN